MKSPAPLLDRTLENLGWPRLLEALGERLRTESGRDAAAALAPLAGLKAVQGALERLGEMMALAGEHGPLPLADIAAIGASLERAAKEGVLDLEELIAVEATQRAAVRAAESLERDGGPLLTALAARLDRLPALLAALAASITPEGELNPVTHPQLRTLRDEMERRRRVILEHLERLLRDPSLSSHLQDRLYTLRGSRYVLPVKIDSRRRIPGIVHDVSASGVTLFVEPQAVVEETNALTLAEKRLEMEIQRILRELSSLVGAAAGALRASLHWLGEVDLLHAQALLARDYGGTIPRVDSAGVISLNAMAHPLMLLAGEPVVRNEVRLAPPESCMVISGANTGGKTVLLTAVGLSALLVRHGMAVPAGRGSRMDLFSSIRADIGDQQSLSQSLSTFSAQIGFVADLLTRAGKGSLVLIDEILTGTEPQEGAALAGAVLETLAGSGAMVFVTTHYGELKRLAAEIPAIVNASVSFDPDRLQPTFRLVPGLPGSSFAFPIARRYGLQERVAAAASERLEHRSESLESLLAQLHQRERELATQEDTLTRRTRDQQQRTATLDQREAGLVEREAEVRAAERGEIGAELRRARARIAAVIGKLQSANDLPRAGAVERELRRTAQDVLPAEPAPDEALTPESLRDLASDTPLWVLSLEREGVLIDILAEGRSARVRLGNLTLEVEAAGLALPPREEGRAKRRKRTAAAAVPGKTAAQAPQSSPPKAPDEIGPVFSTSENALDLRGQRVEDALVAADQFFDLCVVKHVSPVILIHGYGTGRLRAALRTHLAENDYVAAFRPGQRGEGQDGVTIAALNL